MKNYFWRNLNVFLNMSIVFTILIFNVVGSLGAWQPDIDINRVRLITNKESHQTHSHRNPHSRRSIFHNRNDYDHRSRFSQLWSPKPVPDPQTANQATKVQPREDPRYFYLSDTYAKEILENRLSNEVSAIYPGKDVVRATDINYRRPFPRLMERETNDLSYDNICVLCPRDRTLIAKPGSDQVLLQHPRMASCYGRQVPNDVKFIPKYGPKFGSLLKKGSHKILGEIKQKNKILRHCYMNVDVLVQTCAVPTYLIADCGDENKTCNFTCRDPKDELHGASTLSCGDDVQWSGHLPVCSGRNWCEPQPPPPHGRVSCKGTTVNGWGLAEGSTCRIKCVRGRRSNSRPVAMCRRGAWTNAFSCVRF